LYKNISKKRINIDIFICPALVSSSSTIKKTGENPPRPTDRPTNAALEFVSKVLDKGKEKLGLCVRLSSTQRKVSQLIPIK